MIHQYNNITDEKKYFEITGNPDRFEYTHTLPITSHSAMGIFVFVHAQNESEPIFASLSDVHERYTIIFISIHHLWDENNIIPQIAENGEWRTWIVAVFFFMHRPNLDYYRIYSKKKLLVNKVDWKYSAYRKIFYYYVLLSDLHRFFFFIKTQQKRKTVSWILSTIIFLMFSIVSEYVQECKCICVCVGQYVPNCEA